MIEPFLDFEWYVAAEYHWQNWLDDAGNPAVLDEDDLVQLDSPSGVELAWRTTRERGEQIGPVLGPVLDKGKARSYRPMARPHAALFERFAGLDYQNKDALLVFASTYGLLGADHQEQHKKTPAGWVYVTGESHLTWAHEICLMREALDLTRSRTPEELAREIEAYRSYGLEPPREERRARLAWLFNVHLQHVQGRMVVDADVPPRLRFAPLTLLSAMWLQLALAINGDKQFRTCKSCRKLFEISTEQSGFRRHREFCSDSCKTTDYRRRKRSALGMADQGVSPALISKRLETNSETIREWLRKPRPKGKK